MRLGIDLGTTRTVVSVVDRGNFPLLGFTAAGGDVVEHVPTSSAEVGGALVHGHDAEAAARDGAPILRSWKRLLGQDARDLTVEIGRVRVGLVELAADFLGALRRDLFTRSNLPRHLSDPLEAVVAVPANAHSTQRFLTLEAFRRAGFEVRAVMNEPSAAGLEYAHRYRGTITSKREHVVVYDLGGGTFDAALILMSGGRHDVVRTAGVNRLGGDDFDEALLELALAAASIPGDLAPAVRRGLLAECCAAKEALNPSSRRVALALEALGGDAPPQPVVVDVAAYYERVRPLVERTMDTLAPVLGDGAGSEADAAETEVAGLYVVGGASGLPVVPRILRERFGRRVHKSPYPSAATAIGLAIAAAEDEGPPVAEVFTRHFGVFRERAERVAFDVVFAKGTPMPAPGDPPLVAVRRYRAAHNLGHYRFVECGDLDDAGEPCGDITPHAEVRFPFSWVLRAPDVDLARARVERLGEIGPWVEERYEVDAAGVLVVTVADLDAEMSRRFVL